MTRIVDTLVACGIKAVFSEMVSKRQHISGVSILFPLFVPSQHLTQCTLFTEVSRFSGLASHVIASRAVACI
jgi:hypothetical protein